MRQNTAVMARADQRPILPTIRVPTLVVVGENDVVTPVAMSQEICPRHPRRRVPHRAGLRAHAAHREAGRACALAERMAHPSAMNRPAGFEPGRRADCNRTQLGTNPLKQLESQPKPEEE